MPARRSISTWRGASVAAQPSWPAPVKQMSRRRAEPAAHRLGGIAACGRGVHLHLRVLRERIADPAGAQLGREPVVRLVHDDDVERVHETAGALDEVLVPAVERCEPSGRNAARLGARHGRNDARCSADPPAGTGACGGLRRWLPGIMRVVSGPRVIVVGAGVYGLAAARRMALAGAEVTVLDAREAGGVVRRLGGVVARAALRVRLGGPLHRARAARARAVARARAPARRAALRRDRPALVRDRASRSTCTTRWRRARPPDCRCACSSPPRRPGGSRCSRSTASPRCCTTPRAACCRRAAPRSGWRGWRGRRARRCARVRPCAPSATASSSSPTARGVGRPGARRHGRVDGRAAAGAGALDAAGQRLPARSRRPACRSGRTTIDVYGLGDDGGAGLKVGGHALGPDVDPDDPAAREAPAAEVRAARGRGAPAATGAGLAGRRRARCAARMSAATR